MFHAEIKREEFRFSYTLTYFIASQFLNLGLRMDLFLISHFLTKSEVGYYGLSQKIILTIITTIISITQVLSPGFSKIATKREALSYIKTGIMYLLVPSTLFFFLALVPSQVYAFFFTEQYVTSAAITSALALPFIIFSLSNLPLLFLLYTIKKPSYILVSNVLFFIIVTVGSYMLIPKYGVFGPPYAMGIAMSVVLLLQSILSFIEYRKLPKVLKT